MGNIATSIDGKEYPSLQTEMIVNACDKHDGKWVPTHINSRKKVSTCIKCGHEYPFIPAQPEVGL